MLSRRNFIKLMGNAAIGGGALCVSTLGKQTVNAEVAASKIRNFNSDMAYRRVGETDIDVSVFSLGTGENNEEILNKGLQMGINLIHTSTGYSKGKSIRSVAK